MAHAGPQAAFPAQAPLAYAGAGRSAAQTAKTTQRHKSPEHLRSCVGLSLVAVVCYFGRSQLGDQNYEFGAFVASILAGLISIYGWFLHLQAYGRGWASRPQPGQPAGQYPAPVQQQPAPTQLAAGSWAQPAPGSWAQHAGGAVGSGAGGMNTSALFSGPGQAGQLPGHQAKAVREDDQTGLPALTSSAFTGREINTLEDLDAYEMELQDALATNDQAEPTYTHFQTREPVRKEDPVGRYPVPQRNLPFHMQSQFAMQNNANIGNIAGGGVQGYVRSYRERPRQKSAERSTDIAYYKEESVRLYNDLNISYDMQRWGENMRHWVSREIVQRFHRTVRENDEMIWDYITFVVSRFKKAGMAGGLGGASHDVSKFAHLLSTNTRYERASFILSNAQLLQTRPDLLPGFNQMHCGVPQNPGCEVVPGHPGNPMAGIPATPAEYKIVFPSSRLGPRNHIVKMLAVRKRIVDTLNKVCHSDKHRYTLCRIEQLAQTDYMPNFKPKGGMEWPPRVKPGDPDPQPWAPPLPTDADIVMRLFVDFMDDYTNADPSQNVFSDQHFIDVTEGQKKDYEMVKTVAFVDCPLDDPTPAVAGRSKPLQPYYYLCYEPQLVLGNKTQRGRAQGQLKHGWYPMPGPDNIFHAIALFAFFSQKFMGGRISTRLPEYHDSMPIFHGVPLNTEACLLLQNLNAN